MPGLAVAGCWLVFLNVSIGRLIAVSHELTIGDGNEERSSSFGYYFAEIVQIYELPAISWRVMGLGNPFFIPGFTAGTVNGMARDCPNETQTGEFGDVPGMEFWRNCLVSVDFQGSEKVRFESEPAS
jgi:hypothetical protein